MVVVLSTFEHTALYAVIGIAIAALLYALILRRQILRESTGSEKVKEVWNGIKSGANAYLRVQFRSVAIFIGILGVFLYLSAAIAPPVALVTSPFLIIVGRVGAFLMGAFFSAMVGFIGMNMAVQGNIRVTEASRKGFRDALRIAYRTGTITGMLTDGLGLLGGTINLSHFLAGCSRSFVRFWFRRHLARIIYACRRRNLYKSGGHRRGPRGKS